MLSGTRCGGLKITIDVPKEHLLSSTRCGGLEITIDVPKFIIIYGEWIHRQD